MADDKTFTQADIDKLNDKIEELSNKYSGAIDDLKKAQREARAAKDIKPEDLAAAEDRAEKAEKALAEAQKEVKVITTRAEKAEKALESESAFTQRLLISDGLKSALIASGVKDEDFIDSLSAKFASGASIKVEGETRVAMYGDKPLADHVKEWAGTDAGRKFVAAPVNGGGGANGGQGGGGGSNPFAKETFNMTEQAKIYREDPARAAALAKSAGVDIAA